MQLISLGRACVTKIQIEKYNNNNEIRNKETNIFDFIISSFNSVLEILNTNNIDIIFNKDNIKYNIKNDIELKFPNYFISIHDIPENYTENDIDEFINKYKRRYHRMIDIIKNNDIIHFIRFEDNDEISLTNYLEFEKIIYTINPNCKFFFINLVINLSLQDNINLIHKNFYKMNLKNYLIFEKVDPTEGHFNCFDWKKIFNDIKNITI